MEFVPADSELDTAPSGRGRQGPDAHGRVLAGRLGGLTTVIRYGPDEIAARARDGFMDKFRREVDPDGLLTDLERERRAKLALKAHMTSLAIASARSRRRKVG